MNQFTISSASQEKDYKIFIGYDLLHNIGEILVKELNINSSNCNFICITDQNVGALYLDKLTSSLAKDDIKLLSLIFAATENSKNLNNIEYILRFLAQNKIKRNDYIIALGGGMISDLAGFAASIYMRGINYITISTSLLGQIDASIGGKTAVNNLFAKNIIGSFYNPRLVILDLNLLQTLPVREFKSAYAEILKYGIIQDEDFYLYCQRNWRNIFSYQQQLIEVVKYCVKQKGRLVMQDQYDQDRRALLNFGHSFGHALECYINYDSDLMLHGEAVAIGMVLALEFSAYLQLASPECALRLAQHLQEIGLKYDLRADFLCDLTAQKLMNLMESDKKNNKDSFNLILAEKIGHAFLAKNIDKSVLYDFLRQYFTKNTRHC